MVSGTWLFENTVWMRWPLTICFSDAVIAHEAQALPAPVDLRRRGSNEEVCTVAVIRQIAAEAGDARAVVQAVARVQLH